jgi:hypothetical protein
MAPVKGGAEENVRGKSFKEGDGREERGALTGKAPCAAQYRCRIT